MFDKKKTAEEWNEEGLSLNINGNYKKAIKCFDQAIKLEPNESAYWSHKGSVQYKYDKINEAITSLDQAIKLNPNSVNSLNNKGTILFELERYSEAISCFDVSLKLNPNFANTWNGKAAALVYVSKHEEAIKCFDQAIKLDPNNLEYQDAKSELINLMELLKKQNKVRRGWSESEKDQVRINQDGKCAMCQKPPPRWEYDHFDGNRSNNDVSNCQGLCPNCHSVKTHET